VGRSAALIGALLILVQRFPLPVRLFEIGASAGLNLRADHYLYKFSGGQWGSDDAAVVLSGQERLVTAITVALRLIRSDPLGQLMINSTRGAGEMAWLTASPWVADFATGLTGLTDNDPQAAQWVVRVVLSLLYWPVEDSGTEDQMVQRFVAPAFAQQT
jgi:hypothetical protein